MSFIFNPGQELKDLYENPEMRHSLRHLETISVLPEMKMSEIRWVKMKV